MQARRKTRLYIVLAVLAGLGLTVSLTLYALSSNIDLFYTPGEIIYGKTETRALPHTGQRLRVGGYVQPGSLQRDPQTLDVRFKLYDARGVVDVSYKGIRPKVKIRRTCFVGRWQGVGGLAYLTASGRATTAGAGQT